MFDFSTILLSLLSIVIFMFCMNSTRSKYSQNTSLRAFKIPGKRFSEYRRSSNAPRAIRVGIVPSLKKVEIVQGKVINVSGAQHLAKVQTLPENFDWRSISTHPLYPTLKSGNYCSVVENQHAPLAYCGSCWVFASLQTMADRINIMNAIKNKTNDIARVNLSVQQVIDCAPNVGCFTGGDSYIAYNYVICNKGISDHTCKQYVAIDQRDRCDPECYTCMAEGQYNCSEIGETTFTSFGNKRCCKVDKFKKYELEGFSNVTARFNNEIENGTNSWEKNEITKYIQTEIYRYGPVTIALDAIPIETFRGGSIFKKRRSGLYDPELNHLVAIVGYGTDPTTKKLYWIIRNSWGTFWCEDGYIRVDADSIGLDDPRNDFFACYPKGYGDVLGVKDEDKNVQIHQS